METFKLWIFELIFPWILALRIFHFFTTNRQLWFIYGFWMASWIPYCLHVKLCNFCSIEQLLLKNDKLGGPYLPLICPWRSSFFKWFGDHSSVFFKTATADDNDFIHLFQKIITFDTPQGVNAKCSPEYWVQKNKWNNDFGHG